MKATKISFSTQTVACYFDAAIENLQQLVPQAATVILIDEQVAARHAKRLKGWQLIVLPPGEAHKNQATVDSVIAQLIAHGADRKTWLVGIGGGVITDLTGYVAGIYLRGLHFGFVPTTILSMVDACIGGKNGIDVGVYKNMVGLIRQPDFLLYDYSLLKSLPRQEWVNGFAEIIKHACIKDAALFALLEQHTLTAFRKDKVLLDRLIRRNALLKCKVVQQDEFEQGERKLLNFGHTLGHAVENSYGLSHGQAVAIGMVAAAALSEQYEGFREKQRLVQLIRRYGLPVSLSFDAALAMEIMQADKKRVKDIFQYVLLKKTGRGVIRPLAAAQIKPVIQTLSR